MQVRCPQCHAPIDLDSDGQLSDIACPACGSSFSLLGTAETVAYESGTKTIGHFRLLDRLNGSLPRDVETIVLKCLEREPSGRYGTAKALSDDLRRFCCDEPIQARPVSRMERGWRWCTRKPVVAALALLLLLSLVSGTIVATLVSGA